MNGVKPGIQDVRIRSTPEISGRPNRLVVSRVQNRQVAGTTGLVVHEDIGVLGVLSLFRTSEQLKSATRPVPGVGVMRTSNKTERCETGSMMYTVVVRADILICSGSVNPSHAQQSILSRWSPVFVVSFTSWISILLFG